MPIQGAEAKAGPGRRPFEMQTRSGPPNRRPAEQAPREPGGPDRQTRARPWPRAHIATGGGR